MATWTKNFNFRGEWNSTATYTVNDIVLYENALYICRSQNVNMVPTTEPTWQLFLEGGAGRYVIVDEETGSIAVGVDAELTAGTNVIEIGTNVKANQDNIIAIGTNTQVDSSDSVVIGNGAESRVGTNEPPRSKNVVIGSGAFVAGDGAIVIGANSRTPVSEYALVVGNGVSAPGGTNVIALGKGVTVSGCADAIAIGTSAYASSDSSIAIGRDVSAPSPSVNMIVIGSEAFTSSDGAIGIGFKAYVVNVDGVAIGREAYNAGDRAVSIGKKSYVTSSDGISIGTNGFVVGLSAIGIGLENQSNGEKAIAIGSTNQVYNINGIGIGSGNQVYGRSAIGIGINLKAYAEGCIVIGRDSGDTGCESGVIIGDTAAVNFRGERCIVIGKEALSGGLEGGNNGGSDNIAIGYQAMGGERTEGSPYGDNITGNNNVAIGKEAGKGLTSGSDNVFIGSVAEVYPDKSNRVIIGKGAAAFAEGAIAIGQGTIVYPNGYHDGTSYQQLDLPSIAIGTASSIASGYNIAIGEGAYCSGQPDPDGQKSIAIGVRAYAGENRAVSLGSRANVTRNDSIAIGTSCNNVGERAISIGPDANTTETQAISIGHRCNNTGEDGISIGTQANATSDRSIAIGKSSNNTGKNTIAIGNQANAMSEYQVLIGDNTSATGDSSVTIGRESINGGINGVLIGRDSHSLGTDGVSIGNNIQAYGTNSITIGKGSRSSAINAITIGKDCQGAESSVVIGDATAVNFYGARTIAMGQGALSGGLENSEGTDNIAIGTQAMGGERTAAIAGTDNIAIGQGALAVVTSGNQNVAIGREALNTLSDGTNCVGLGYNAQITGNNQVQLGDSATTVYAYGAVQDRSDERDKADIRDTELGLDFILKLRPVDFKWDFREDYPEGEEKDGSKKRSRYHHGLIAQDVQQVIADTGIDFGGFQDHSKNGGKDVLSIGYTELIAPLIKAVQEQNELILRQQQEIIELRDMIRSLVKQ